MRQCSCSCRCCCHLRRSASSFSRLISSLAVDSRSSMMSRLVLMVSGYIMLGSSTTFQAPLTHVARPSHGWEWLPIDACSVVALDDVSPSMAALPYMAPLTLQPRPLTPALQPRPHAVVPILLGRLGRRLNRPTRPTRPTRPPPSPVRTTDDLRNQIAAQLPVIEVSAGHYPLGGAQLTISHDVVIRPLPGAAVILDAESSSRLFLITAGIVTLTGLSITGGQSSVGGGLFISGSNTNLTLEDCTIYNNTATTYGGGLYLSGPSTLIISRAILYSNTAARGGGGLAICPAGCLSRLPLAVLEDAWDASLSIVDSTFHSNRALVNTHSKDSGGGGLLIRGGMVSIARTSIHSNSAASNGGGGGIFIYTTPVVVDGCSIHHNEASYGGGLFMYVEDDPVYYSRSPVTVQRSEIYLNTAHMDGGGVLWLEEHSVL